MTREETIERLAYYQSEISKLEGRPLSDADFAKRFLLISSTVLSRFRAGSYGGNELNVIDKCETAFADIDARLGRIAKNAETDKQFLRTTFAKAVLANVNRAKDSADRRVVVALFPAGGGKTKIGRFLEARGGVYVEGRKSWRRCYKAFCSDVASAAGRGVKRANYSESVAESEMLAALSNKAGVLYIDEAGFLGNSTIDAIKLIVNRTD